jgi:hypothetical protein
MYSSLVFLQKVLFRFILHNVPSIKVLCGKRSFFALPDNEIEWKYELCRIDFSPKTFSSQRILFAKNIFGKEILRIFDTVALLSTQLKQIFMISF